MDLNPHHGILPQSHQVLVEASDVLVEASGLLPGALDDSESVQPGAHADPISERTIRQDNEIGEIKARTLYKMVEDINVGMGPGTQHSAKLLFLTEKQASLLTDSAESIPRIIDAFEITKPKLVIRLLLSCGGIAWCRTAQEDDFDESEGWHPAWFTPPWLSISEGRQAEQRLERFMGEVLIPLAVETNAVILCDAMKGLCMLTEAFCDAMSLCRSRWAGEKLHFTLIGFTCDMESMYHNSHPDAFWKHVRSKSPSWQARDPLLRKAVDFDVVETGRDLHPAISNFVVGDNLNEAKGCFGGTRQFASFCTHMSTHLTLRLPGLCFKTGMGTCIDGDTGSTYCALEVVESGMPLVLLDVRERPQFDVETREELIKLAWKTYEEACDSLMGAGAHDSLDLCALGYFHSVLFEDGNYFTTGKRMEDVHQEVIPLCQAIQRHQTNMTTSTMRPGLHPASSEQAQALLSKFADRLFSDSHTVFTESPRTPEEFRGIPIDELNYLGGIKHRYLRLICALSTHHNLHTAHVADLDGVKRYIGQLARMDRVPKHDSLSGLLLLREAWEEYDIMMYLADRYKLLSKTLYLLLLALGIATVLGSVLREELKLRDICRSGGSHNSMCFDTELDLTPRTMSGVLFGLALLSGSVASVTVLLNPAQRWRQLRSSACALQSAIWQYRARVGDYTPSRVNIHAAQQAFSTFLHQWREELVAGTDLQSTAMERHYKPSLFKHMQWDDSPFQRSLDDFHSPVNPQMYIALRLRPAAKWYRQRIPRAAQVRFYLQVALIVLSAVSAMLTQIEGRWPSYVTLMASMSGAITSWQEFVDLGRKVERYTVTVRGIKNLLSWWSTLDGVEQASKANIERLIEIGESVLNNEFRSWSSTAGVLRVQGKAGDGSDGGDKDNDAHNNTSHAV